MRCALISCLAAVAGLIATAGGAWLVRGSTALPAAIWGVVAWAALAGELVVRAGGGLAQPAAAASVRLLVVSLALCPTLALLGAKRPQHGVWQFIVATLAIVLALPAASAALARPGSLPAVHPLESWLILIIALVGWLNFIGTRRRFAATLFTIGLMILMRPFLPLIDPESQVSQIISTPAVDGIGTALGASATGIALAQAWAAHGRRSAAAGDPLATLIDPPFLALRETLGAAWTLRIAERFDALATSRGWPIRLRFEGLEIRPDAAPGPWQRDAQRAFTAIMRRFVSPAWLRRHGQRSAPSETPA
jgi:hypothetical protein